MHVSNLDNLPLVRSLAIRYTLNSYQGQHVREIDKPKYILGESNMEGNAT